MRLDPAETAALAADAVECLLPEAASPYLLIAEHAGNKVPAPWRNLGLAEPYLATHFAVDLGVDALTRRLSQRLQAPAVVAHYSRLFLDYNRPVEEWDHMRPDLGGIPVPGNLDTSDNDRRLRREVGWAPLEQAIADGVSGRKALVSIHSFTPIMGGVRRNVDIGILWREPSPFVSAVLRTTQNHGKAAGLVVGDNEPYDWRQAVGYTLNRHGLQLGLPSIYLEVRNDLLTEPDRLDQVSRILEDSLSEVAKTLWPDHAVAV
ncbi:N-formylglutamate amidohydrolase [Mesorhizobium sp. 1M-11]|uniref:N-formylglutamate amidohydrolase n=1 Tax=Mesorhizobium sp. 1M-11 TaxID=1529006 RepID=UPI0006C76727|nr:N-formylglutamate amidohydrolase [Mesorhizobium sp. 1M-11]